MHGDEKFRQLSRPQPNGQSLWLHLIMGPHTTAVPGLSSIGEAGLAEAIGWSIGGFRKAWREIERLEMAEADWQARVIWLPNAIRHNVPESPNVVRGWRDTLDNIPECALKTKALTFLQAFLEAFGEAFAKAFRDVCGDPSPNQEQEQEQEQERSGAAGPSRKPFRGLGVLAGALPRDHRDHVFCSQDFSHCVPAAVHGKLSRLLAPKQRGDTDQAGEVLKAWYPTVVAALLPAHVMGDAFKFWQGRFDQAFATKDPPAAPASTVPDADRTSRYLREQNES
jgi:hypothetical protein